MDEIGYLLWNRLTKNYNFHRTEVEESKIIKLMGKKV